MGKTIIIKLNELDSAEETDFTVERKILEEMIKVYGQKVKKFTKKGDYQIKVGEEEINVKIMNGSIIRHKMPNGKYQFLIKHSKQHEMLKESEKGTYGAIKKSNLGFYPDINHSELEATENIAIQDQKLVSKKKPNIEKVLKLQIDWNETETAFKERVRNEYNCLKIFYPGIPKPTFLHDAQNITKAYLTMPFIPGEDLFEFLLRNNNSLSMSNRQEIALWVFHALEKIHKKGVIHSDVKLENCLIDLNNKSATFIDFGFAFLNIEEDKNLHSLGTERYQAPELFINKPSRFQRDIWSAGILLSILYGASEIGVNVHMREKLVNESGVLKKIPNFPDLDEMSDQGPIFNFTGLMIKDLTKYSAENLHGLLKNMLSFEPDKRPDIKTVIDHLNKCYCKLDDIKLATNVICDAIVRFFEPARAQKKLQAFDKINEIYNELVEIRKSCNKLSKEDASRDNQELYEKFASQLAKIVNDDELKKIKLKMDPHERAKSIYVYLKERLMNEGSDKLLDNIIPMINLTPKKSAQTEEMLMEIDLKKLFEKPEDFTPEEKEALFQLIEGLDKDEKSNKLKKKDDHKIKIGAEEKRVALIHGSIVKHSLFNKGENLPQFQIKLSKPLNKGAFGVIKRSSPIIFSGTSENRELKKTGDFIEKVIKKDDMENEQAFNDRVMNEYKCLKIIYPNIPEPIFFQDEQNIKSKAYLAMPFFSGKSLDEFFNEDWQKLTIANKHKILLNILQELEKIHKNGIIHSDIKPENFIINPENYNVTLTDFGAAFLAKEPVPKTRTGSPQYMAPELMNYKKPLSGNNAYEYSKFPRDIWSAGVLLSILLGASEMGRNMAIKLLKEHHDISSLDTTFPPLDDFLKDELEDKDVFNFTDFIVGDLTSYSIKNLYSLLKEMLSINPKERPEIGSIIEQFKQCYCELDNLKQLANFMIQACFTLVNAGEQYINTKSSKMQSAAIRKMSSMVAELEQIKLACDTLSEKIDMRNDQTQYQKLREQFDKIITNEELKKLKLKFSEMMPAPVSDLLIEMGMNYGLLSKQPALEEQETNTLLRK